MNPHQKNKVDVKSLSPEEFRIFRLYGKLPTRSDHFAKHLKDRKYFDSGDYAMSKAGKGDGVDAGAVGSQHPVPENIPHLSSPVNGGPNGPKHTHHGSIQAVSPVKESSFLNRETSAEGATTMPGEKDKHDAATASASPEPAAGDGIPIRH
ncbi:cAMP-regulated phosphoprotein/endosulfine domain-containing protein [Hirsutella rhossiliensis]|uniref:mRNA stability protein n=1 Tax=Hirsutella rhossiliensis TaxID=111463 RepID=A0A9P8N3H4_9HYPO|nr:cAMP-regulated phosphoprotein/endosulfine domain-containing protein [Hirsutella rhossiliensis]KAH0967643.1 cAMP-regulated phosphoprotein/endosulfine domain-containing protein [Hirsutella rhossiliensis]